MHISLADAKQYIYRYFAKHEAVAHWMTETIAQATKDGYVTTLWGRRRYIAGLRESNKTLYQEACRIAINTIAQGTAAELMKVAMINLQLLLAQQYPQAALLLQIHDELLLEVPSEQIDHIDAITKKVLEEVVTWPTPLEVTTRRGADWQTVSK
jgi:DNA polymerase-1